MALEEPEEPGRSRRADEIRDRSVDHHRPERAPEPGGGRERGDEGQQDPARHVPAENGHDGRGGTRSRASFVCVGRSDGCMPAKRNGHRVGGRRERRILGMGEEPPELGVQPVRPVDDLGLRDPEVERVEVARSRSTRTVGGDRRGARRGDRDQRPADPAGRPRERAGATGRPAVSGSGVAVRASHRQATIATAATASSRGRLSPAPRISPSVARSPSVAQPAR